MTEIKLKERSIVSKLLYIAANMIDGHADPAPVGTICAFSDMVRAMGVDLSNIGEELRETAAILAADTGAERRDLAVERLARIANRIEHCEVNGPRTLSDRLAAIMAERPAFKASGPSPDYTKNPIEVNGIPVAYFTGAIDGDVRRAGNWLDQRIPGEGWIVVVRASMTTGTFPYGVHSVVIEPSYADSVVISNDHTRTNQVEARDACDTVIKQGDRVSYKGAYYPVLQIALQHDPRRPAEILIPHPDPDHRAWILASDVLVCPTGGE